MFSAELAGLLSSSSKGNKKPITHQLTNGLRPTKYKLYYINPLHIIKGKGLMMVHNVPPRWRLVSSSTSLFSAGNHSSKICPIIEWANIEVSSQIAVISEHLDFFKWLPSTDISA
jgi:hypothetical protein